MNVPEEYQSYYNRVLKLGYAAKPRGLDVVTLQDQEFLFTAGSIVRRPHGNIAIGFVELFQFAMGIFNAESFKRVAPHARLDLFTGQSAYGPRTAGQFERVVDELKHDKDSRRAVITIMHHDDVNETIPCTLSMQFQVHAGKLFTTVIMRSSDAVWGLPYDIIQFGGIAMLVAACVEVDLAPVLVQIGNAHIYDSSRLPEGDEFTMDTHFSFDRRFTSWASVKQLCAEYLIVLEAEPKNFIAQFEEKSIHAKKEG